MRNYFLVFLAIISLIAFAECSKKTTAQKKNKQLRKSLKAKSPEERRMLRFERKLKLSGKKSESVHNVKEGKPHNKHDVKVYNKYYKKKRRIEKKISKITWRKQQSIQTHKTKKRMNRNRKKAGELNRYKRNQKINK